MRYEFGLNDIKALIATIDDLRQWQVIDFNGNPVGDPAVVINIDIDDHDGTCTISTKHSTRSGKYATAIGIKTS